MFDNLNLINPDKVKDLILKLVKIPSVSGTTGECIMAQEIVKIIKEIPYFQVNTDYIQEHPLPGIEL